MLRTPAILLSSIVLCAGAGLRAQAGGAASGPPPLAVPLDDAARRIVAALAAADDPPRTVTWRGRIEDARHRAMAGVTVRAIPNGPSLRAMGLPCRPRRRPEGMTPGTPAWFDDVPLARLPSAVTDAHGRFALAFPYVGARTDDADVSEGLVRPVLVVVAPGMAARFQTLDAPQAAECRLQEITLEPEAAVRGTVVNASGTPLPYATVRVFQERADPASYRDYWPAACLPELCEASTDAGGRFELKGLWTGEVTLELRRAGSVRLVTARIPVQAGETAQAGRLVLRPGGTIRGSARDSAGQPLVGGEIVAVEHPRDPFHVSDVVPESAPGDDTLPFELLARFDAGSVHAVVRTDGSFELADLGPGAWTLYALAPGHEAARRRDVARGTEDVRFTLAPEARWDLQIVAPDAGRSALAAHVDARRIGCFRPAPDGSVRRPFVASVLEARADEEGWLGSFALLGAGPLGTQLLVCAPGRVPQELMLPGLAPGEVRSLEIALAPE